MKPSLHLFDIAGFKIGAHYSWAFSFVLISWYLSIVYYPSSYTNWTTEIYWIMGLLSSILLFFSILLHELAHALIARRLGLRIVGITLFIFGGITTMEGEPQKPRDELFIAGIGPIISLVLSMIFLLLFYFLELNPKIQAMFGYIAVINGILGAFNLIPGFPLDGGRILRSILWTATNNPTKATVIASKIGQVCSFGFAGFGLFQIFNGIVLNGIWIILIGWFLNRAAISVRRDIQDRLNKEEV